MPRCALQPTASLSDGNPALGWCLGNVVGKANRRGNLCPTKQRSDQKIDAAVAPMMAIGRTMSKGRVT
jgi:phage terminase large subunit-like protein